MVTRSTAGTLLILLASFLLAAMCHADKGPTANVDRYEIRADETLTLTLTIEGQLSPVGPDLTPLRGNFDVLSNRQSSRHSIINGRRESGTEWHIELAPRRAGVLTIPALEVADGRTEPLSIKVLPADDQPVQADNRPVFLEAEIDHSEVYVQQQILLTVRIFQAVQLDDMNITEPSFDHASVRKVSQTRYQRQVGALTYRVHELVYAIFPQQSGELTIPELVFSARQPSGRRSMFDLNPGVAVRDLTPQFTVTVLPPPDRSQGLWLPARSVQLREQWHGDPQQLSEGESITRRIELIVDGQPASHLPELKLTEPDGVRLYADQPKRSDSDSATGVQGSLVQSVALVPTRAGEVTLPPMRVTWWNTESDSPQVAELPARTLQISASTQFPQPPSLPRPQTAQPGLDTPAAAADRPAGAALLWPWQLATAVLACLWLITLGLLSLPWRNRRGAAPGSGGSAGTGSGTGIGAHAGSASSGASRSEAAAWKKLNRAARANDPVDTRNALLAWASLRWPAHRLPGLEDIAQHVDNSALQAALEQLEQQLYGQQTNQPWRGQELLDILQQVRHNDAHPARPRPSELPPLNP